MENSVRQQTKNLLCILLNTQQLSSPSSISARPPHRDSLPSSSQPRSAGCLESFITVWSATLSGTLPWAQLLPPPNSPPAMMLLPLPSTQGTEAGWADVPRWPTRVSRPSERPRNLGQGGSQRIWNRFPNCKAPDENSYKSSELCCEPRRQREQASELEHHHTAPVCWALEWAVYPPHPLSFAGALYQRPGKGRGEVNLLQATQQRRSLDLFPHPREQLITAGPSDIFPREKCKVLNNLNLYSMLSAVFTNIWEGNMYGVNPRYFYRPYLQMCLLAKIYL